MTAPGTSLERNATAAVEGARSCRLCGRTYALWGPELHCTCGGPLAWTGPGAPPDTAADGIWRYAGLLPPVSAGHRITLGEAVTPVLRVGGLVLKLDYLLPTGSF